MQLFDGFPRVVAFWIALPFKEILQLFVSSKAPVFPYCFHFVFVFAFDKIRWGTREVGAVGVRFDIWGEKTGMKHRMYVPLSGEFQTVCDG